MGCQAPEGDFLGPQSQLRYGVLRGRFFRSLFSLASQCFCLFQVLSFNNIAADFIHGKWIVPLNSSVSANTVISMTYLTAGCLSPFMGAIIDRVGCRAILNIVAAVLIALVHLALGQTTEIKIWVPIALLVVLGLWYVSHPFSMLRLQPSLPAPFFSYSIYAAALWPSVALIVDEELCGTAYGVVTAIQNLGLAVVPLIVGQQFFTQNNYTNAEWVFFGLGRKFGYSPVSKTELIGFNATVLCCDSGGYLCWHLPQYFGLQVSCFFLL